MLDWARWMASKKNPRLASRSTRPCWRRCAARAARSSSPKGRGVAALLTTQELEAVEDKMNSMVAGGRMAAWEAAGRPPADARRGGRRARDQARGRGLRLWPGRSFRTRRKKELANLPVREAARVLAALELAVDPYAARNVKALKARTVPPAGVPTGSSTGWRTIACGSRASGRGPEGRLSLTTPSRRPHLPRGPGRRRCRARWRRGRRPRRSRTWPRARPCAASRRRRAA